MADRDDYQPSAIAGPAPWMLATKDAHGLYAQFAFMQLHAPERMMERLVDRPDYSAWG